MLNFPNSIPAPKFSSPEDILELSKNKPLIELYAVVKAVSAIVSLPAGLSVPIPTLPPLVRAIVSVAAAPSTPASFVLNLSCPLPPDGPATAYILAATLGLLSVVSLLKN